MGDLRTIGVEPGVEGETGREIGAGQVAGEGGLEAEASQDPGKGEDPDQEALRGRMIQGGKDLEV